MEWTSTYIIKPENNKEVIIAREYEQNSTVGFIRDNEWFLTSGDSLKFEKVTHWMPLPEPPKI